MNILFLANENTKKRAVGTRWTNPANRNADSGAMLGLMFSASSLLSRRQHGQ